MSILADKLRGVLFSNLRHDMPRPTRQAAWELFNAIDSDLDIAGYIASSPTDELSDMFDDVLAAGERLAEGDGEDILPVEDTPVLEEEVDVLNLELEEETEDDEIK